MLYPFSPLGDNMKKRYSISGMTCAACVSHVERAIGKAYGGAFTVSLLTGSATVSYPDGISDAELSNIEERLRENVRAAGYALSEWSDAEKKKEENERQKRRGMTRLILSVLFTLALMYVAMGPMLSLPLPDAIDGSLGTKEALASVLVQGLLTLPVLAFNFKFFASGFRALVHLSPNMDSLVALGSGASFVWGVVAILAIAEAHRAGDLHAAHAWLHDLYFESAAMILTLVSLGKRLENGAKNRASEAVEALSKLAPDTATVRRADGREETVPTAHLAVGDLVVLRAGELIPVDGDIVEGVGACDRSALTGESMPVELTVGERAEAACVLVSGFLVVKATHVGAETTLSGIIRLVEEAASSKAPIARVADRVSRVFVPAVMAISLLTLAVWLILTGGDAARAFRSAISVLVISCPCALGLATPTAITVAIGRGAGRGILFCNAEALERLGRIRTVVFDKTGTLTEGVPTVTDVLALSDALDEGALLRLAGAVESRSAHPLAGAITAAARARFQELPAVEDFEDLPSRGASACVDMRRITVGRPDDACDPTHFPALLELESAGKTVVAVTLDGVLVGLIAIADRARAEAREAVRDLKNAQVRTLMLTGDNPRTAASIASDVDLDGYFASLMPADKERIVSELSAEAPVCMVGDGINDSPALMRADVGIAIGAGTDAARSSADVVLGSSRLSGVADAFFLSRATMRVIRQNLFWALFYNAVCIPVAAGVLFPFTGLQLSPMLASAAMSLSSVSVVLNALRLYRVPLSPSGQMGAPSVQESPEIACKAAQSCPISQSVHQTNEIETNNKKGEADMSQEVITHTLHVGGMMCPRCVAHVEKALAALDGVTAVTVSLEDASATVTALPSVTLDALKAAVVTAGYEV